MENCLILCEGVTDQFFIAHCLSKFYNFEYDINKNKKAKELRYEVIVNSNIKILEVGGCSKITNNIYLNLLKDNEKTGGVNIVIFDADENGKGNNGITNCRNKLNDLKKNNELDFEYYLWPNNQTDGDIENLLKTLIPVKTAPILDCVKTHRECLNRLQNIGVRIPKRKDEIRYYLYTCFQDSTPTKINYSNTDYWDLDNGQLTGLKGFFDTFFL